MHLFLLSLCLIAYISVSNAENGTQSPTSPSVSPTSPDAYLTSIFYSTQNATFPPTSTTNTPTVSPSSMPSISPTLSPTILLPDEYSYSVVICINFTGISVDEATDSPSVFSLATKDILGISTDIDIIVYGISETADGGVYVCMEIVTTNGYSYNTIDTMTSNEAKATTFQIPLLSEIQSGFSSAAITSMNQESSGTKLTTAIYPVDVETFAELFFTGYLLLGLLLIMAGSVWLVILRGPYENTMSAIVAGSGVISPDNEIASMSGGGRGGVQLVNTAGGVKPVVRIIASTSATVANTRAEEKIDESDSLKRRQTKDLLESAWNDDEVAGPNSVETVL